MIVNHYPWKSQNLITWINQELTHSKTPEVLASDLKIPAHTLQEWAISPAPTISLEDVRAIAQYRGWGVDQTLDWLGITPAHWDEMLNR
ncbi:MAG TPA: hypothetical protein V6D06_03435 [Trichocoleus sp.]